MNRNEVLQFHSVSVENPNHAYRIRNLSFYVLEGECVGLIGLNDAGKKTFVDLLLGEQEVTEGQIYLNGQVYQPNSIDQANRCGIYHISRYTKMVESLSLEENMTIMNGNVRPLAHARQLAKLQKMQELLEETGFASLRNTAVINISAAQKYLLEILRAILSNAKIILLSDILYVFDHKEDFQHLLDMLRYMQKCRITIIYISNRFHELLENMDKVLVLQQGRLIKTLHKDTFSRGVLEDCLCISDAIVVPAYHQMTSGTSEVIRIEGMRMGAVICDALSLHAGEVLGIYDDGTFAESFTTELFGEGEKNARVYVDHKLISHTNYRNLYKHGIGILQQVADGVYYDNMTVRDNLLQMNLDSIGSFLGFLRNRMLRYIIRQNQMRLKDLDDNISLFKLNHRDRFRVLLEMNRMMHLRVLTVINPSLYHDPIEVQMIYNYIAERREDKGAVFFISSIPAELFNGIADRVIRICKDGSIRNIENVSQLL